MWFKSLSLCVGAVELPDEGGEIGLFMLLVQGLYVTKLKLLQSVEPSIAMVHSSPI